jgi:hypothetical protein
MLSRDIAEGLISFRRIYSNQPDPNRPVHIEDGDFVTIVDLNDFADKRICTRVPASERANRHREQGQP